MTHTFTLTGKKLAAIATVLIAVLLAMTSTIVQGVGATAADTSGVTEAVVRQSGEIPAGELAQWMIAKRQDFQLIDLRDPWQFDDYHIPTAISIPMAQFFSKDSLNRLDRGKKIVLYGSDAGAAAQAQLLLSLKGYNAYSLREGIGSWWQQVMTPTSLRPEKQSPAGYQQARQIRSYFMGAGTSQPAAAPPAEATPAPAPAAAPPEQKQLPPQKLKLGKGCS